MATLDLQHWVNLVLGGLMALSGLALACWSQLWDRAKGRRRCPKCWYDMAAAVGTQTSADVDYRCPECGKKVRGSRRLLRTRRRWRWTVVAAFLLLLSPAPLVIAKARKDGPWSLVSTKVLVELVPVGGCDGPFAQELMRRLGRTATRSWLFVAPDPDTDNLYVSERLRNGNVLARPGTDSWRRSYGRFIQELKPALRAWASNRPMGTPSTRIESPLADSVLRLGELPLEVTMRTRDRWPEGVPLWIDVRAEMYWPWTWMLRVRVADPDSAAKSTWHAPGGFSGGKQKAGRGTLRIDAEVEQVCLPEKSDSPLGRPPEPPRQFEVPYFIDGGIEDILTPVRSPALDALLASTLVHQTEPNNGSSFNCWDCVGGPYQGMAFGVILEFYLDGKLTARERCWWDGTARSDAGGGWQRVEINERLTDGGRRRPSDAQAGENWTVIMRDDPETALRVIDENKYWKGTVTIPFSLKGR